MRAAAQRHPSCKRVVDTGYSCRFDGQAARVTRPPPGKVSVGGYRFCWGPAAVVRSAEATLVALPDALNGQRLAGASDDCAAVQASLSRLGVNPLLIEPSAAAGRRRRALDRASVVRSLTAMA